MFPSIWGTLQSVRLLESATVGDRDNPSKFCKQGTARIPEICGLCNIGIGWSCGLLTSTQILFQSKTWDLFISKRLSLAVWMRECGVTKRQGCGIAKWGLRLG
jgi:hypothetical protein